MSTAEEGSMDRPDRQEYRLLVIGKSGNGKSCTCNTIVGNQRFKIGQSFAATTRTVDQEYVTLYGRDIRVIDTPDVTNCDMTQKEMEEEVARWREVSRPYPTAVLLTIRCDVRYTAEEYAIYRQLQRLLGDNTLQHRLVVAFTFADRQDAPIEEELKTVCPELKKVLREARHRYVVFNNKASNKEAQVQRLLNVLDTMSSASDSSDRSAGPVIRGLLVGTVIAGLCFAATITANKSSWATASGLLFALGVIGIIIFKVKRKMP